MPQAMPRNKKKLTKPVKHRENTQRRLFDFGFLVLVDLFIFLGWVGLGLKTPTTNTDVTLPSLNLYSNLAGKIVIC